MYSRLKGQGKAVSDFYAGKKEYFFLSPAYWVLLRRLEPLLRERSLGRVLDAGAGRGAYRPYIEMSAQEYVAMDVAASEATTCVGDIQRLPFADDSFDTVFCSQVLEHVPEPTVAIGELRRVLKPGGTFILTVPHISWLHNEPHDYFRFTPHGLRFILERAGLCVSKIEAVGGLFSLLGHVPSTMVMSLTFGLPRVHRVVRTLNKFFVKTVVWLDLALEKKKIFALNYLCIGKK